MMTSSNQIEQTSGPYLSPQLKENINQVAHRIAPMWPLHSFVAVNPFLGFSEKKFDHTVSFFRRVNRINLLMPLQFYIGRWESGEISRESLALALTRRGFSADSFSIESFIKQARADVKRQSEEPHGTVATISEILDRRSMGNRQISLTDFMIQEISKFCALYFDLGQAQTIFPFRSQSLYEAWRSFMELDKSPHVMGLNEFDRVLKDSPSDPFLTIAWVLNQLEVPTQVQDEYLYRALFDIKGWASYARHIVWQKELQSESSPLLTELLAIRVLWGYALFYHQKEIGFRNEWRAQMIRSAVHNPGSSEELHSTSNPLLIFQEAFESSQAESVFKALARQDDTSPSPKDLVQADAPILQAVFCIDVRSEPLRRALESVDSRVQTFGAAGFFGVPFKFDPQSETDWVVDQAPALISPKLLVQECSGASCRHDANSPAHKAPKLSTSLFKSLSTSGFSYVESLGVLSLGGLLAKTFNFSKAKPTVELSSLHINEKETDTFATLPVSERAELAVNFLRSIDLTKQFANIVLIVGHGSESVNNAHAAGLECGACGGHSGDLNARVMSSILNDRECRAVVKDKGIEIPESTVFLPALHNTTSDEIRVLEDPRDSVLWNSSKSSVLNILSLAGARNREFRVEQFENDAVPEKAQELANRGKDWSQVRPEWGLAGNSFFIVAPRDHTQDVDLKGKSFLHSYNWREDADFTILEQIMTAPMIVTSWINLQYFASAAQPEALGAGNKAIHNVIGKLGVVEGNSGDLKLGLAIQSVHDGKEMRHLPLRLNVVIAAPREGIANIVEKHQIVKDLVHNNWLHLFSQLEKGQPIFQYTVDTDGQPKWFEVEVR